MDVKVKNEAWKLKNEAFLKFYRAQLPKMLGHRQFLTILTSESLSGYSVAQKFVELNLKKCSGHATF